MMVNVGWTWGDLVWQPDHHSPVRVGGSSTQNLWVWESDSVLQIHHVRMILFEKMGKGISGKHLLMSRVRGRKRDSEWRTRVPLFWWPDSLISHLWFSPTGPGTRYTCTSLFLPSSETFLTSSTLVNFFFYSAHYRLDAFLFCFVCLAALPVS